MTRVAETLNIPILANGGWQSIILSIIFMHGINIMPIIRDNLDVIRADK